jgi:holliday junction DNA helicase RuvA
MITFLEGSLVAKEPARVVLNVGGVGYEVLIPLSSYDRLPRPGEALRIWTYDHVREDEHLLFGFMTEAERRMFTQLMNVNGIGPKLALGALSGLSVRDLTAAIAGGDVKRLTSVSGIGKKTAERMIVELRDKISAAEALEAASDTRPLSERDTKIRDAILALVSLGYKRAEALEMVKRAVGDESQAAANVEQIVRKALAG